MLLEERAAHVRYALARREEILKSKIDKRFIVSISVVGRRLRRVRELREELTQIVRMPVNQSKEAEERLDKLEDELFGAL